LLIHNAYNKLYKIVQSWFKKGDFIMRIVLIGQAAFGEKVLQTLTDRGEEVAAVYTPPDIPGREDPLKQLALRLGIKHFQPKRMRDPEVYKEYAALQPDLNVMAFVTDIVPESMLDYPGWGTIQYHPSLLPRHRGGSAINWAVINGETKTGVTIFWPDKGLDTGPILLQKEVEISPDDTVGSLYFNVLFPLGVDAIVESLDLIKKGKAPRISQDESKATYEGLCTEKNVVIKWSDPVMAVYNLIRGTNPQPGAITYFQGKRLKIFDAVKREDGVNNQPGEIIEIVEDGFAVSSPGGAILVKKVQPEKSPKIKAVEFARQVELKAGDVLGT
jgi:methionyl-tRNA formyltransferase